MEKPAFLIVAGPNGSGKSTAYSKTEWEFEDKTIWIINPDDLTRQIVASETRALDDANLEAVIRIEAWLAATMDVHQSVGVETVLSTTKYQTLVRKAKALGFEVWLIYIVLDNPDLNVERVRLREAHGGHGVPEDKIRRRYVRSLANMPWFLTHADRAWLYDNSGAEIREVGRKQNQELALLASAPDVLTRAVTMTGQT